tara:strand:- start:147 stop:587 length:441 start_codon:yes stop_codon:yes gene_type:complete
MIGTTVTMLESGKGFFNLPLRFFSKIYQKIHNIWESHRPWGHYKILEDTENRKVKTIFVEPGKRLSLQKHLHRSEYWLVASGVGIVQVGEKEISLKSGNSVVIPKNTVHRVTNPGQETLVFIEIQIGDYLEEDDIIRLDDDYGRLN